MNTLEGNMILSGARIAIVAARFNDFIVDRLVGGAVDTLKRHGASDDELTLVRVPGAWELPLAVDKLAATGDYAAVIALGCVIRGGTPHFEYVCSAATKGVAEAQSKHQLPIAFGLLTCDSIDQAVERAGAKAGNKGVEAASAVIEMVNLCSQL